MKNRYRKMFPPGCFNPFVEMQWYIDEVPTTGEKKRKRIDHMNSDTENERIERMFKRKRAA